MPQAARRRALPLFVVLIALVVAGAGRRPPAARAAARQVVIVALEPSGPAPGTWSCLPENPSCARHDQWWEESLLQAPAPAGTAVEFSPLGAGFNADPRLAEAVLWVWSWPDGRQLLRGAAAHGVSAGFAGFAPSSGAQQAVARYDARTRSIEVDAIFAGAPSWLLGDVLAHELTHAAQDSAGRRLNTSAAGCVSTELPARRAEVAYAGYLLARLGTPPAEAAATLPQAGLELYRMVQGLLESSDLPGLVARLCAAQPS
ncbi:MAG TPA: hypothetical protein VKV26_04310 [Dehalococcoidia bacterium]|nr:hypothetical protein [Dehalococcoidia bacterium]